LPRVSETTGDFHSKTAMPPLAVFMTSVSHLVLSCHIEYDRVFLRMSKKLSSFVNTGLSSWIKVSVVKMDSLLFLAQ
jgi:hypothetical protein